MRSTLCLRHSSAEVMYIFIDFMTIRTFSSKECSFLIDRWILYGVKIVSFMIFSFYVIQSLKRHGHHLMHDIVQSFKIYFLRFICL